MLTKDDLKIFEKSIRKIVHEEVKSEIEDLDDHFIAEIKLARIRLEQKIDHLDTRVKKIEKSNIEILKQIKKLKVDLNKSIGYSDRGIAHLEKRADRIEKEL